MQWRDSIPPLAILGPRAESGIHLSEVKKLDRYTLPVRSAAWVGCKRLGRLLGCFRPTSTGKAEGIDSPLSATGNHFGGFCEQVS